MRKSVKIIAAIDVDSKGVQLKTVPAQSSRNSERRNSEPRNWELRMSEIPHVIPHLEGAQSSQAEATSAETLEIVSGFLVSENNAKKILIQNETKCSLLR